MAHVVPRRDPCIKCNNPVFFAERLVIEDHLYHRTCFRCARCDSVLTLGNFYQTEKDNEFCCETCPDEELKSKRSSKVVESNRLSIAQRIALFEKSESSSVLKKSLSDEEKSKSLSRQLPQSTNNSQALNSFLTSQINSQEKNVETDDDDEKTNESMSSDSESDDEDKHNKNRTTKGSSISERKLDDNSVHNKSISSDNNVNSTKEPTEHDNIIKTNAQTTNAQQQSESQLIKDTSSDGDVNLDTNHVEDDIELEFEKLAEEAMINSVTITTSRIINNNNDKLTALAPQEKPQIAVIINSDDNTVKVPNEQIISVSDKEDSLVVVNEAKADDKSEEKVEEVLNDIQPEPSAVEDVKVEVEPEKIQTEAVIAIETESITITDTETVNTQSEPVINQSEPVITETEPITTESQLNSTSNQYPDDLNPFGDDEEEVVEKVNKSDHKRPSLNPFGSCSEDEEEDKHSRSYGTLQKPPRPPPPRTSMTLKSVSTNPFGSDDEDDDESVTHKNSIGNKTPVPTPRKQL